MLFRRQRALLSLVEALDGRVGNRDFQKLLFLWSREPGQEAFYDFVPYKFGAFSFTSYADKRKLIAKGFIEDDQYNWVLTSKGLAALREDDIRRRAREWGRRAPRLRGDRLVALTYRRHPYFAIRSQVAERVLADDPIALHRIQTARPPLARPGVATIGYEGRSLESYLVALLNTGVTLLCDVRRNPISRRYGFSKSTLANGCKGVGIRYEHLRELGIPSSMRRDLETQADYDALFEVYDRELLPLQGEVLARIATWVDHGERVALTCYERDVAQCHRGRVAAALERQSGTELAPLHL